MSERKRWLVVILAGALIIAGLALIPTESASVSIQEESQEEPPSCNEPVGVDGVYDINEVREYVRCYAYLYTKNPELFIEINEREGSYKPGVCNYEYGCISGQGLMQIVRSTFAGCERALGRDMDVFDPSDNLDCGRWLLEESPGGINHWAPYSGPY